MTDLVLSTAIANYGHTVPLKDGSIGSPMFSMAHTEVSPVPMIFRRMVRTLGVRRRRDGPLDVPLRKEPRQAIHRAAGLPHPRLLPRHAVLQRPQWNRGAERPGGQEG